MEGSYHGFVSMLLISSVDFFNVFPKAKNLKRFENMLRCDRSLILFVTDFIRLWWYKINELCDKNKD